jgi:flagellar biosynthesis/type III secretory pathway protein FliH
MALWKESNDDDFFGKQQDDDDDSLARQHGITHPSGLANAEEKAAQDRYGRIGYHEGYEETKETRLQEGFETGYKNGFESAVTIGRILGELRIQSRIVMSDEANKDNLLCLQVAKLVRDEITRPAGEASMFLTELEQRVKEMIKETAHKET